MFFSMFFNIENDYWNNISFYFEDGTQTIFNLQYKLYCRGEFT